LFGDREPPEIRCFEVTVLTDAAIDTQPVDALRPESHVASLYREAERELLDFPDEFNDLVLVTMVIMLAHTRACRASMYLYGKLHGAAE
jgi:hypothetical protein